MAGGSVGIPGLSPVAAVTAAFRNRPRKCSPAQPVWQDGPACREGSRDRGPCLPAHPLRLRVLTEVGTRGRQEGAFQHTSNLAGIFLKCYPVESHNNPVRRSSIHSFHPSYLLGAYCVPGPALGAGITAVSESLPSVPIVNEIVQPRSRGRRQDGPLEGWRCLRDWQVRPSKFWGSPGHPLWAVGPG